MKVFLCAPLPPPVGGIATWTCRVLQFRLPEVELIHYNNAVPELGHFPSTGERILRGIWMFPRQIFQMIRLARREKIDVCHVTTSGSLSFFRDVLIALVLRLFGKKTLYHMHFGRIPELSEHPTWETWLLRILAKVSDGIVAIDFTTFAALEKIGVPDKKRFYLPNFIDFVKITEIGAPLPEREPNRLFFAGNISWEKGIETLFAACEKIPEAKLVLAGRTITNDYIARLKAEHPSVQCEWLGVLPFDEVIRQMRRCTCFVFPSFSEGFPLAVAEAMGCRCPIIATAVGAIPEMLDFHTDSDACGIEVPVDDPDKLGEAIRSLLRDPEKREKLGNAAYEKCRRCYDAPVVMKQLTEIWMTIRND